MSKRAIALQLIGYAALLALIYTWLGIADRSIWQVLLSLLLGAAIVFGTVWLFGAALAAPARFELRRLPKLILWLLVAAALIIGATWLAGYRPTAGAKLAARLTLWFRHPVKPQLMGSVYVTFLWIAGAAAVLAVLPFASGAAEGLYRGAASALRERRYWLGCALAVLAGVWLPRLLAGWVPKAQSLNGQFASMLIRLGLAYVIAVAAWLALARLARFYRSAATR